MASTPPSILGIERSLSGRVWRWRGGNMDFGGIGDVGSLEQDLVTHPLFGAHQEAGSL